MKKLDRFLPILLSSLAVGCSGIDIFRGETKDVRVRDNNATQPREVDKTTELSDAILPCGMSTWKNDRPARIERLFLPYSCVSERTETKEPNRAIDVVFALDVTGSMGNELSAVRAGVQELIGVIQAEGWQLRAGSIAFADSILEENPITADLSSLLLAMSPDHDTWSAPGGFGGDAPEIGLMAIEKALEMLEESDPNSTVSEKVLVYVSDAPAEREHKKGFDIAAASEKLRSFDSQLETQPQKPSFRMFHSTSSSRRGLLEFMPTPSEQISNLVTQARISNIKLPFPLDASGVRNSFIAALEKGRLFTEHCNLRSATLLTPTGAVMYASEPLADSPHTFFTVKLPSSLRKGSYTLLLKKECLETGDVSEKIAVTF